MFESGNCNWHKSHIRDQMPRVRDQKGKRSSGEKKRLKIRRLFPCLQRRRCWLSLIPDVSRPDPGCRFQGEIRQDAVHAGALENEGVLQDARLSFEPAVPLGYPEHGVFAEYAKMRVWMPVALPDNP
jgi:hypothetical protein